MELMARHMNIDYAPPNCVLTEPIWNDDSSLELASNSTTDDEEDTATVQLLYQLPIQSVCRILVDDFSSLLVAFQRKHGISDSAMDDLCKLCQEIILSPNNCPSSMKVLKRRIQQMSNRTVGNLVSLITKLCGHCSQPIRSNGTTTCECTNVFGRLEKPARYFVCNVQRQLEVALRNYGPAILKHLEENALDFLHNAYEGSGNDWSIGHGSVFRLIDLRLGKVKFPCDFQRRIPSLEDWSTYKASEFKNLLLYGLIPCVTDVLAQQAATRDDAANFLHWLLIYHEIATRLNCDTIVTETLNFAAEMIDVWQQMVPHFLGETGQTYNTHAMAHLVHFVRLLGPLHRFSTFAFESFVGTYASMITSAHGTISQVTRRFEQEKILKHWIILAKRSSNGQLRNIAHTLSKKVTLSSATARRYGRVKLLSEPKRMSVTEPQAEALSNAFLDSFSDILCVGKVKVQGVIVASGEYESVALLHFRC